jgi:hypothetical protein
MAITLGAITLPPTLVWEDEFSWMPVSIQTDYSLTGALIVQTAARLAGRPITLVGKSDGNQHTGGLTRSALLALREAITVPDATFTLTLHDARTFNVIAAENPLDAEPLPVYRSFYPATPADDRLYLIRAVRLLAL